ncbi:MAG: CHAT domain-containing protein, partial [Pseudonocardiaceae bacterium]
MTSSAVEAYLSAGRVAQTLGRTATAVSTWTKAHELSQGGSVLVRVRGRVAAALAARVQQRHDSVLEHSRAGLDDLARHRVALASTELRALASGHGAELGGLGLASLAASRSAVRVLEWMERTRAAALAVVDPPSIEGIEEELGALRAVHTEIQGARRTGVEPRRLLARQAAIENRIRQATWKHRSPVAASGTALSTAVVRRLLEGRILVEYDVVDGAVLAAVLEPRRTRVVRLGPFGQIRMEINALLFALRRLARGRSALSATSARASAEVSLAKLVAALITPLRLPEHRGLVVVPVGELQRVPWSALHTAPVSVAPSAALWARTRQRSCPPDAPVVLVAGPELPGAVAEIQALQTVHERSTVLIAPASRIDPVTRALDGASLVHLACHGYIRTDNPTFSSMLLSDGHLTVAELDQRGIAPHRIVLAACESGSDVLFEGNETLGFISTLIARGTAGLIASSVVVPDWNVVGLMCALHARVRSGDTLAEALYHARTTVDPQAGASFVSWCAFNAFGAA